MRLPCREGPPPLRPHLTTKLHRASFRDTMPVSRAAVLSVHTDIRMCASFSQVVIRRGFDSRPRFANGHALMLPHRCRNYHATHSVSSMQQHPKCLDAFNLSNLLQCCACMHVRVLAWVCVCVRMCLYVWTCACRYVRVVAYHFMLGRAAQAHRMLS